jgi:hypothetical protein
VPSRFKRRISASCFLASDNSQPFAARSTAFRVSSSALSSARRR